MENVRLILLWPSCHCLWTCKASPYFNESFSYLILTFTFYTHISLSFSTSLLIRSDLLFGNTHLCFFAIFSSSFSHLPQWPIPKTSCTLSSISPSGLSLCFALCLFLGNTNVAFSISALTLNFFFTPREERVRISCLIFGFIMRWPFGMWLWLTHGLVHCMGPLTILKYFSFSQSLSINLEQFYRKGKSFWPDLHLPCPLQKPLFSLAPHAVLHYLLLFYDFPASTIMNNFLFPLRNLKFLDNAMNVRSSVIQGRC